jgi:hypothetical protein
VSAVSANPAAQESGQDSVRALQHALYRAAKADPGRRFHALADKVYRRDVLQRAWVQVRRNSGAAGIDGKTIAEVEQYGVSRLLDELATDLKGNCSVALAPWGRRHGVKMVGGGCPPTPSHPWHWRPFFSLAPGPP